MAGSSSPLANPKPRPPKPKSYPTPLAPPSTQMAPPSLPKKRKVRLPENEELAGRLLEKHRSMMTEQPGGLSENLVRVLSTAYRELCASKRPVRTPGDQLRLKGVGTWVISILKDSFPPDSSQDLSPQEGSKRKYVPRKNSAAYAIVITLYKEMISGKDFMTKQELIDAAEASGLSEYSIGPNNSRSKPRNSQNDWYTGWSCIKTLISKALVVKWSNPAMYMLTEEGKKTARDCLARSGLDDTAGPSTHHFEEIVLSDSDSDEPYLSGSDSDEPYPCDSDYDEPAMSSAENPLLAMPPRFANENFRDSYEVVLILDDRETFGRSTKRDVADNISSQFHIPVEMKHLPIGDAIWIARHKVHHTEYVLDLIIERKNVVDLVGPIRDNRYKDQKLRLKNCGIRKLIYLVEGDPNTVDAPEIVKTACFTTEILEGFDVQRTTGYSATERKYGHLTRSIIRYYRTNFSAGADTSGLCMTYDEFVRRCSDLAKVTMSDIFALQLMQVPQATEEAVLAVTSLYPTLLQVCTQLLSHLLRHTPSLMAIGVPKRRC